MPQHLVTDFCIEEMCFTVADQICKKSVSNLDLDEVDMGSGSHRREGTSEVCLGTCKGLGCDRHKQSLGKPVFLLRHILALAAEMRSATVYGAIGNCCRI